MKFFGKVGFAVTTEIKPGIWKDTIVEYDYSGDFIRNITNRNIGDKLNDEITFNNRISIISDPFASRNYASIKYVEYMGVKWKVKSVSIEYPRLVIDFGGVYND